MDFFGLLTQIATFGCTGFDIGSDIANSLNFLGVFKNDTYNNITSLSLTNLAHPLNAHSTIPFSATNEMLRCATMDQREDVIWGVLSLVIVFLPGAFMGISLMLSEINNRNWCGVILCLILGIPLLSAVFPFIVLGNSFVAIIKKCQKKELAQNEQFGITRMIGLESSVESTSQLLLQLFTLLNGYHGTSLQKISIVASFFQIARCSILNDIESKIELMGGKSLTSKESLMETIYRLPTYSSTIIFRIGSLCLTMAYLRYYSLIPIALLVVMQTIITLERFKKVDASSAKIGWPRIKKLENRINWKIDSIVALVGYNIGVVADYGSRHLFVEDEKEVLQFIKNSTIASFMHHSAMLIIIMILGRFVPNVIDHGLDDRCDFPLEPGSQSFFWVFGAILFMGFYSVTAILNRAPSIVKVETSQIVLDHE